MVFDETVVDSKAVVILVGVVIVVLDIDLGTAVVREATGKGTSDLGVLAVVCVDGSFLTHTHPKRVDVWLIVSISQRFGVKLTAEDKLLFFDNAAPRPPPFKS